MSTQIHLLGKESDRSFYPESLSEPNVFGRVSEQIGKNERVLLWVLAIVTLLLRARYAATYRVDSDEFQHLHVVWGWTQGLLPYRDLFDNHAPLFQMLCAPLLRLFGERADILYPMRLAMIPFYGICVWSIYHIGSRLYSHRVGLWSAAIAALMPRFFQTSTEFRTDDLWAAFWLVGLAVLVSGFLTPKRIFSSALFFGLAFAVSLKTSLLLASLILSGAMLGVMGLRGRAIARQCRQLPLGVVAAIAGLALVPCLLVAFFWWKGALSQMIYCTVQHNVVPDLKRWGRISTNRWYFIFGLPSLILASALYLRQSSAPIGLRRRRALVVLAPLIYVIALYGFWPDITREDFLPFAPLLALLAVPAVLAGGQPLIHRCKLEQWHLPAALGVVEIALILHSNGLTQNEPQRDYRYVSQVLQLTNPGEYFMDSKSGAIFRNRPFYYVLETITRSRVSMGLIPDTIAESLEQTRTAVVDSNFAKRYPKAEEFVSKNYIPLNASPFQISVLGQLLHAANTMPLESKDFTVSIPASYRIVSPDPTFQATLDGKPVDGPRFLEAGPHELRCHSTTAPVALFWQRAWEKGFQPVWEPSQSESAVMTPRHSSGKRKS